VLPLPLGPNAYLTPFGGLVFTYVLLLPLSPLPLPLPSSFLFHPPNSTIFPPFSTSACDLLGLRGFLSLRFLRPKDPPLCHFHKIHFLSRSRVSPRFSVVLVTYRFHRHGLTPTADTLPYSACRPTSSSGPTFTSYRPLHSMGLFPTSRYLPSSPSPFLLLSPLPLPPSSTAFPLHLLPPEQRLLDLRSSSRPGQS
jgi:hypothetical protein